jgi:hypothetical protein
MAKKHLGEFFSIEIKFPKMENKLPKFLKPSN